MPGLELSPEAVSNRNNLGAMSAKTESIIYGSKASDILSFLPSNLLTKYIQFITKQIESGVVNSGGDSSQVQALKSKSDLGRGYEEYLAEQREQQINKEIAARTRAASGGSVRDLEMELQEIELQDRKRDLLVPKPTMDTATKRQFILAVSRNPNYLAQLQNAISNLMKRFGSRLQFGERYYDSSTGRVATTPIFQTPASQLSSLSLSVTTVEERLTAAATVLYQIIIVGGVAPTYELPIRGININTGQFEIDQSAIDYNKIARRLKLPLKGVFVTNDRINGVDNAYKTFTGTDIKISYALGFTVGNLKGVNTITWSIHRGKELAPLADQVNPVQRARGRRTIAGTIVFSIFDEHPITAIYPQSFFPPDPNFTTDSEIRQSFTMPDSIPALDLTIILQNEYGYASIMSLFGVEFMDDTGGFNLNDLVNEEVIHYTAKSIDLLHSVRVNPATGLIDPYDLAQQQENELQTRRSEILVGEEGLAVLDQYDAYYSRNFQG